MTFTDDDLKWLKDNLPGPDSSWVDGYSAGAFRALIARLEAAERCAKNWEHNYPHSPDSVRWRKAAGR